MNTATPIIPRDGVLTITDGAALSLVVPYLGGAIKISGLNASQKTKQTFRSKGTVYAARDVEDQDYSFEFDCDAVHFLGDGVTATLFEALMKRGVWAGATSTLPLTAGDVYCVKCSWGVERTNFNASNDNLVAVKYCHFDVDFAEGVPSKFSLKGSCIPYSTDHFTAT